jgi:uncharacterized membrane protein (DUF106 family)
MTGEPRPWRDRWPIAEPSRTWHYVVTVLFAPFAMFLVPPLVVVFLAGLLLGILFELASALRKAADWLREMLDRRAGRETRKHRDG